MRTPAQLAGHPIHPMLVPIPIGLWLFSFACDVIATRVAEPASWVTASEYAMVGGILGALAAALPGLVDLLSLRGRPIQKTAIKHMVLNLVVVALFAANAWLRLQDSIGHGASLALSAVSIALLGVSGWLGGKMVYEAGVAVNADDDAATRATGWQPDRNRGRPASQGFGTGHAMAADSARPSRNRNDGRASAARSERDTDRDSGR